MLFKNRKTAGLQLATKLREYLEAKDVVVVGLPRGGVVVAASVANFLRLPLGVVYSRKLKSPTKPELAVGAINQIGEIYWDKQILQNEGLSELALNDEISLQFKQIKKRISDYKQKELNLKNKTVLLVDDGIATGATVIAAIKYLQKIGAKRVVVASPVASTESTKKLFQFVDEAVVLKVISRLKAVVNYYEDFSEVSDEEVVKLLKQV